MTIKEAIDFLNTDDFESAGFLEATGMAIKALEQADKYRWHDLYDKNEQEKYPEIKVFGQDINHSAAVEVIDDWGVCDTAMIVEHHLSGDCNKVYEREWYFGKGGKWEEFENVRAWRYIATFSEVEE